MFDNKYKMYILNKSLITSFFHPPPQLVLNRKETTKVSDSTQKKLKFLIEI